LHNSNCIIHYTVLTNSCVYIISIQVLITFFSHKYNAPLLSTAISPVSWCIDCFKVLFASHYSKMKSVKPGMWLNSLRIVFFISNSLICRCIVIFLHLSLSFKFFHSVPLGILFWQDGRIKTNYCWFRSRCLLFLLLYGCHTPRRWIKWCMQLPLSWRRRLK